MNKELVADRRIPYAHRVFFLMGWLVLVSPARAENPSGKETRVPATEAPLAEQKTAKDDPIVKHTEVKITPAAAPVAAPKTADDPIVEPTKLTPTSIPKAVKPAPGLGGLPLLNPAQKRHNFQEAPKAPRILKYSDGYVKYSGGYGTGSGSGYGGGDFGSTRLHFVPGQGLQTSRY